MIVWTDSGSRRSESVLNPTTSAKRTVTCLRSPSRALFEVRIFSARCLGVYESTRVKRACRADPSPIGLPHLLQNLESAGSSWPQARQQIPTRAPQFKQKLESFGFSEPQLPHLTSGLHPQCQGTGPMVPE